MRGKGIGIYKNEKLKKNECNIQLYKGYISVRRIKTLF